MSDLKELYQEVIMDHNRRPRNFRALDGASCSLEGFNPLCGDRITLDLKVEDDTITDVGFQGSGCAISKASASLMTESIKGKKVAEAEEIFESFHDMLTKDDKSNVDEDKLGDLAVFSGVAQFPTRIKCAILAWHTLHGALKGQKEAISTE